MENNELLSELHLSLQRFTPLTDEEHRTERQTHDWANYRSVLTRAVRRRGLKVPHETRSLLAKLGLKMGGGA